MFLLENGLLHLDPTWINDLLWAILDHRLADPEETPFWDGELVDFVDQHPKVEFDELSTTHQTFCATGTLTVSYLKFLWRELKGVQQEGVFDRLLDTMQKHGVLFSASSGSVSGESAVSVAGGMELFVPVRLLPYTNEDDLLKFSAPCLENEWRRQLVYRVWQSYVPPGIIGMFMARLLAIKGVQLHCAWSRGVSFMMGGSEVMLFLSPPDACEGKTEIEVHVVGPKRSDQVEAKVVKLKEELNKVLRDNFPGLLFDLKDGKTRSFEGKDALMDRIDTLEEHLDVRFDTMEGELAKVAESSRESLMCLKDLQGPKYQYPHLVVVREHKPSFNMGGRGKKKRVLSKALFKSFFTRARALGEKKMRLQFLCPFDFSEVPCGPDGQGYSFGETRGWVKKVFPAVQVCVVSMLKLLFKHLAAYDPLGWIP